MASEDIIQRKGPSGPPNQTAVTGTTIRRLHCRVDSVTPSARVTSTTPVDVKFSAVDAENKLDVKVKPTASVVGDMIDALCAAMVTTLTGSPYLRFTLAGRIDGTPDVDGSYQTLVDIDDVLLCDPSSQLASHSLVIPKPDAALDVGKYSSFRLRVQKGTSSNASASTEIVEVIEEGTYLVAEQYKAKA